MMVSSQASSSSNDSNRVNGHAGPGGSSGGRSGSRVHELPGANRRLRLPEASEAYQPCPPALALL
jgi:hypothetical protein